MKEFIALRETVEVKRERNKSAFEAYDQKNERLEPVVAKEPGDNQVSILQLYYTALIQFHSSAINNRYPDTSYFHCT